jgi:hypothetical protein
MIRDHFVHVTIWRTTKVSDGAGSFTDSFTSFASSGFVGIMTGYQQEHLGRLSPTSNCTIFCIDDLVVGDKVLINDREYLIDYVVDNPSTMELNKFYLGKQIH